MCSIHSKSSSIKVVPKVKYLITLSSLSVFIILFYTKYISFPNYPIRHSIFYLQKSNTSEETYLVNTNSCRILYWPPFTEEVLPFYINRTGKKIRCLRDRNNINGLKAIRFNYSAIHIENLDKFEKLYKCYGIPITRDALSDERLYLGPKSGPLNSSTYFDDKLLKVECLLKYNNSTVYEEVVPLIQNIKSFNNINISFDSDSHQSNLPNIVMIGLDSISRLNFLRHFPYTKKLLEEMNFQPLYGYTKVADNTFVNLVPLLTGEFVDKFWNETISESTFFDSLPLIWKHFEKRGHLSFLAEDAPLISTFNFMKRGFKREPSHYYMRPFSLSIESHIRNHCYKEKMELEVFLNYLHDFIEMMKVENQKYFAFMFMARLTHDDLNNAGYADLPVYEFFTKLSKKNLLNESVVIFFSDHGIRFGPIRRTLTGKIEERLPFMFIHIPESLRSYSHNLKSNKNRLTTPFDIHATLMHILKGKADRNLRHGLSLLQQIPKERTCADASILEHWCVCQIRTSLVNNKRIIGPMAQFIIDTINEMLESYKNVCHTHKLNKILSAYQQHFSDKVLRFKNSVNDVVNRHVIYSTDNRHQHIKHYLITIRTQPKHAIFESTVRMDESTNVISIVGDISRINRYGIQNCTSSSYLRKYCLCK